MLEVRAWMFPLKCRAFNEGASVSLLLLIYLSLAIFFMCFMYLFQPLLPDPHSNMNMTYDHCRLLREKHNDKVSVLIEINLFLYLLMVCEWASCSCTENKVTDKVSSNIVFKILPTTTRVFVKYLMNR